MLFSLMITGICDFPREGLIDSSGAEYSVMFWKVCFIPGRDRGRTQARIMLARREEVGFAGQCSCMCLKEHNLVGFCPEELQGFVKLKKYGL